jgi:hypothetical protein
MILKASHTHFYPGNRGTISGLASIADLGAGCDCLVEFVDGSAASARISRDVDGWQLQTCAYRTAAGTDIAEKRWSIGLQDDGGKLAFRVLGKSGVR